MRLSNSQLFVGGVPTSVVVDNSTVPFGSSFAGSLRNIKINGRQVIEMKRQFVISCEDFTIEYNRFLMWLIVFELPEHINWWNSSWQKGVLSWCMFGSPWNLDNYYRYVDNYQDFTSDDVAGVDFSGVPAAVSQQSQATPSPATPQCKLTASFTYFNNATDSYFFNETTSYLAYIIKVDRLELLNMYVKTSLMTPLNNTFLVCCAVCGF